MNICEFPISPVTRQGHHELKRLAKEVEIMRLMDSPPYPWAREHFYSRRPDERDGSRLVAYSVDSRGRIIRGWRLNRHDLNPTSIYRSGPNCPGEAAWLDSLTAGKPSEPAYLHLGPLVAAE